jgi:ferredoxin
MIIVPNILLMTMGSLVSAALAVFAWQSVREGERRAVSISIALAIFAALLVFIIPLLPLAITWAFLSLILIAAFIASVLFHLPIGRVEFGPDTPRTRFDERDIAFARARLEPGSPEHAAYYAMRPEKLALDDKIRRLPGLLSHNASKADPLLFSTADASFAITEALCEAVDGPVASTRTECTAEGFTSYIKGLARHVGAKAVGVAELKPYHIYSHVGRGSGVYGAPITLDHRYAIAFTVEMDHRIVGQAPEAPLVVETARKYVEAAVIAIQLSNLIRSLGYPARAHIDGNYRVIAPLIARDSGLGELGRMGILLTPKLGPRVRLGVVTTDLPLVPDGRRYDASVIDFCRFCLKCAENCPSQAIPEGDRIEVDGALRWRIDADRCFHYWNVVGTDCGVCMAVCPYSHPDKWTHNLVRLAMQRSGMARRAALWLEEVFYGRKPAPRRTPNWTRQHASS